MRTHVPFILPVNKLLDVEHDMTSRSLYPIKNGEFEYPWLPNGISCCYPVLLLCQKKIELRSNSMPWCKTLANRSCVSNIKSKSTKFSHHFTVESMFDIRWYKSFFWLTKILSATVVLICSFFSTGFVPSRFRRPLVALASRASPSRWRCSLTMASWRLAGSHPFGQRVTVRSEAFCGAKRP